MNVKIIIKIKNLIRILINSEFVFRSPPKKKDIVIFDNESVDLLLPLCKDYDYFILKNRHYQIDKIYISPKIVLYVIKNFFKTNLSTIYLSAIIEQINPKLVITIIDNSSYFSNVAKILHKKFKFLAIQGAARYDIKQLSKKFFIPEFCCFGEYEKDLYNEYGSIVNKFNYYGSLKQSYYIKSGQNIDLEQKYDIALLSEACPGWSKQFPSFEESVGKIAFLTIKLAKKHNLKLIFVGKRSQNSSLYQREINFYKNYISDEFYITPRSKEKFSSYISTQKSNLVIGMVSTLLRENLGANKKILSCNFTSDQRHDFPVNGICNLKSDNSDNFEKTVLKILKFSEKEYFNNISKNKNYVMEYNSNNHAYNLIKNRIKKIIHH
jgi:surface carbohydrate biosynthesis protein